MEAAELTQVLSQQLSQVLGPIQQRLTALEDQMKSAKPSKEPSPASSEAAQDEPEHGPGLCDDQTCQGCLAQGQEIVDAAFAQGKIAALEDLDQWLIQAGGEDFRQKIIELAARGKVAYEQSQQEVRIVA